MSARPRTASRRGAAPLCRVGAKNTLLKNYLWFAERRGAQVIAERAKAKGITQVAFDRSGFKYHGRVKALAEAAREAGLKF